MNTSIKNLTHYLKCYRKEVVLAPLFKLLEAFFDLLVPVIVAKMIDTPSSDRGTVIRCFLLLLLMALLGLLSSVTAQKAAARASTGYASDLRKALFSHIRNFSFQTLDRIGTDTLITRLTSDVNQIQTGLNMALRLLLRSPFIVFGAAVMAFTISRKLSLIFLMAIPVLLFVTFFIMKLSIPLYTKSQGALDRVTELTRENLTGVRVVRAFRREERSTEEFREKNRELTSLNILVSKISSLLNPVTYVLINLATVILIKRSAVSVDLGELGQGDVVALYNYMLQIIVELIKLASLIITINRALACCRRVSTVMNTEEGMTYPEKDKAETATDEAVVFDSVSFAYPGAGKKTLEDISFSVKRGQTVGIIGGTGSGKTTLVNLIARFYDRTEGSLLINGRKVEDYTKESITSLVTVVFQKSSLFRGSVRMNMLLGNEGATDEEIWLALEKAQAAEIVKNKGGLDAVIEQNGRNLSGGQKQRLAIARALVKGGEILILDDSSSALDYKTDADLRREISRLDNMTVFIVSQRISSVKNAGMILVLDRGRLAGKGTHEELLRDNEVYRDIYYSQFPEAGKEVKA